MIKKLSDKIFYMPHSEETDRPSLGLICGSKCSLIIDSGNSPNHAKEFLSEINSINISPVKYLLITHWHWDHVFGIKDMNLVTIANNNTKEKLDEMKKLKWDDASLQKYIDDGSFSEFTIECIKKEISERENFTIGDLDIIYRDGMEIDLGDVKCIIKKIGGNHTDDSSIIYVPEEKVLFLGDCIYGGMYKGVYGYTEEKVSRMIDEIEKFDAEHYIISHEDIYDKNKINDLWKQLRAAEQAAGKSTSSEEAAKRFSDIFHRKPSKDESFYIKCFVDVNKVIRE